MAFPKKYLYSSIVLAISAIIFCSYLYFRSGEQPSYVRDYQEIKKEGVLRVATTYSPVGYYVEGDKVSGFNHDLIDLLKSISNMEIQTILMSDIKSMTDALSNNECDIVIANIPITSSIKDSLAFTNPITLNKLVLVQRKESFNNGIKPIRNLLELANCSVHVASHSPAIVRIRNLAQEIGDSIYPIEDLVYSNEQLAMKVSSGEIELSVIDENTAKRIRKELPEVDFGTEIGFTHFEAWVLRQKSPTLLDSVNTWIDKIKRSPEYSKIYKKYYK